MKRILLLLFISNCIACQFDTKNPNQSNLASTTIQNEVSALDSSLIKELQQIRADDQKYRKQMYRQNITPEEKEALWEKQNHLDSINLQKVNQILQKGHPTTQSVGKENTNTLWLVLHHQDNLEIRNQYLPILEKAMQDGILTEGALKVYQKRSNGMKQ